MVFARYTVTFATNGSISVCKTETSAMALRTCGNNDRRRRWSKRIRVSPVWAIQMPISFCGVKGARNK